VLLTILENDSSLTEAQRKAASVLPIFERTVRLDGVSIKYMVIPTSGKSVYGPKGARIILRNPDRYEQHVEINTRGGITAFSPIRKPPIIHIGYPLSVPDQLRDRLKRFEGICHSIQKMCTMR